MVEPMDTVHSVVINMIQLLNPTLQAFILPRMAMCL
jgi:hypothetical protein